ncbi:hypothetical protein EDD22DRAFT_441111 [Suillus occidentalis]|nr:hypothetical protein EDD22DRAFT_441111 [Suillus occidentalis]
MPNSPKYFLLHRRADTFMYSCNAPIMAPTCHLPHPCIGHSNFVRSTSKIFSKTRTSLFDPLRIWILYLARYFIQSLVHSLMTVKITSQRQTIMSWSRALTVAMSGFFRNETEQASAFFKVLQEHDISLRATTVEYASDSTSGDMQYKGFRYAIAQVGAGVGSPRVEPHMLALSTYIHSTGSLAKDWPAFRFPCMLITLALFGQNWNFLDFSGCCLEHPSEHGTDLGLFQLCLITLIAIKTWICSRGKLVRSGKHFGLSWNLTRACHQTLYLQVLPIPTSNFWILNFQIPAFRTRILILVPRHRRHVISRTAIKWVVPDYSFPRRQLMARHYASSLPDSTLRKVHQLCASGGFAPALHGFEHLPGKWYMIVMEMITDDYCCLGELSAPYPHHDAIATGLQSLHQERYVHGNIQKSTIMVKRDCSPGFKLVHFDWSGIIGEVRYPVSVPRGDGLCRHDGARCGQLVLAEHDVHSLHAVFPEGTFNSD